MGRSIIKTLQATLISSVAALAATSAFAQNSGITAGLTLTTRLGVDNNPGLATVSPGTEIEISEDLTFSVRSETSTQLLEFSLGTGISFEQTIGGGSSSSFREPTATLHYFRDGANSNLDLSADYWTGDVSSSFDIDPTDVILLIVDTGTLTRAGAAIAYNWGVNAPLGFSFNLSTDRQDYEGTTDPALFDSTTNEISISANMRISPATQGVFSVSKTDFSASDAASTSTQTMNYGLSITHELARALTLDASIGYRDRTTTAGAVTSVTNGFLAGLDVTQDLPNGSIFGGVQFDGSGSAASTDLTFGRTLDLPRGSLSASLTADMTAGSPTVFLGSASYVQELPDGAITVDISQSVFTDDLDQDIKFSTIGIGYDKTVNANSTLNLALDYRRSEEGGGGALDTLNRTSLSATYSMELTEDWAMSVGYLHRLNTGSAIPSATSDSVFLTLTRDLQFGF